LLYYSSVNRVAETPTLNAPLVIIYTFADTSVQEWYYVAPDHIYCIPEILTEKIQKTMHIITNCNEGSYETRLSMDTGNKEMHNKVTNKCVK